MSSTSTSTRVIGAPSRTLSPSSSTRRSPTPALPPTTHARHVPAASVRTRTDADADAPTRARSARPLLLYFDINQTIILCDTVCEVSAEDTLQMLLADHSWGEVVMRRSTCDGDDDSLTLSALCSTPAALASADPTVSRALSWRLVHPHVSIDAPGVDATAAAAAATSPSSSSQQPSLISYSDYLDLYSPWRKNSSISLELTRLRKDVRTRLRASFTERGHPGAAMRDVFERTKRNLRVQPVMVAESAHESNDGDASTYHFPANHYVAPAFYRLLIYLQHVGRPFSLVFRTFGQDLPHVQREFNAFCEGRHPCFPGIYMDGSGRTSLTALYVADADADADERDGAGVVLRTPSTELVRACLRALEHEHAGRGQAAREQVPREQVPREQVAHVLQRSPTSQIDRRAHDTYAGYMYRTGKDPEQSHVVLGALPVHVLPAEWDARHDALPGEGAHIALRRHHGFAAIHDAIHQLAAESRTLAIRDFYPFWEMHHRSVDSGKVLLVDDREQEQQQPQQSPPASPSSSSPLSIFFDDSVHQNIVDVRALLTGALVPHPHATVLQAASRASSSAGSSSSSSLPSAPPTIVWHARMLRVIADEAYFIDAVHHCDRVVAEAS